MAKYLYLPLVQPCLGAARGAEGLSQRGAGAQQERWKPHCHWNSSFYHPDAEIAPLQQEQENKFSKKNESSMSETTIFLKMLEKGISADTLWHSWGWADNTISQLVTKASQELLFSYFCCASKCVLINTASIIPPNASQVWSLFFILLLPTEFTMWKWLFAVTSHFVAEISKKLLQTNVALRSRHSLLQCWMNKGIAPPKLCILSTEKLLLVYCILHTYSLISLE